jgi:hypothetical protein
VTADMSTPRPLPEHNPLHHLPPASVLGSDPRWQLVERILSTGPFQKSIHLPALLSYLAEHSIRGHYDALTERRIGMAVFGKPPGYSPAEDSAVRVHVRQLRLRIHEYYACEGRRESLMIEIPKGSYLLEFRSTVTELTPTLETDRTAQLTEPAPLAMRRSGLHHLVSVIAVAIAFVCAFGWYHSASKATETGVPWPLNSVIQANQPTRIVVADGNSMLRLLASKQLSLDEYLQPGFLNSMIPPHMDENVSRLVRYISESQLTSYADLIASSTLLRLAGTRINQLIVCSSRDLNERDLGQGNYIFIGGPTSNPWVSQYEDRLNFEVVEDEVGGKMYFVNKNPNPGEQPVYEGLKHTGSAGDDYATISLLPGSGGQGNVLILQGLRQEGTEALAVLLANASNRKELQRTLGIHEDSNGPIYFEALFRAHAVAGAPVSISIVATRIIKRH